MSRNKAQFALGEFFTFSGVLETAIRIIDHYARWESLVSLQEHIGFLASPVTSLVLLVAGLILIHRSMQQKAAELIRLPSEARLHDADGNLITPSIKMPSVGVTIAIIALGIVVALCVALIWIMRYEPPLPRIVRADIPVPMPCKTDECFPKPSFNAFVPINVSAPNGMPIVGNKGTVNNPTVNNMNGQAGINIGQSKSDTLNGNISVGWPGISIGSSENTTMSGNMSFKGPNDGVRTAPKFPNTKVGTIACCISPPITWSGPDAFIDSVRVAGKDAGEFDVGYDPDNKHFLKRGDELVAGSTWFVLVRFKPTTVGSKHATLVIELSGPKLPFYQLTEEVYGVAIESATKPPPP